MKDDYPLKITSAVVIDGRIRKAGAIVEVSESVAKQLLARGKAVLATAEDIPAATDERPDDAAPGEQIDGQGLPPAADQAEGEASQPPAAAPKSASKAKAAAK